MPGQESHLEETATPVEDMQESIYEEEETISLSDLPLYSHVEWEEEGHLSSSVEDYSEFNFSQELSSNTDAAAAISPPENVICCGKLIPHKQPDTYVTEKDSSRTGAYVTEKDSSRTGENTKKQVTDGRSRHRGTSMSRIQSRNGNKKDHHVQSSLRGPEFQFSKMSSLTSSSSGKARWYLFVFGIRSFSTKMELRDIRSRQNRRQNPSPPPSPLLSSSRNQVVSRGRNNRGWGFWAMIRALSCGGNHQNETTVTPFIGCDSPE